MPTGITHPIYEGENFTFEQFMLRCARSFGALIIMREEPISAPIPDEFLPSEYHAKQISKLEKELDDFTKRPPTREELEARYKIAYDKAKKDYDIQEEKRRAMYNRYSEMLSKVENWTPPTEEHSELKKFAISQLKDSIDFDCKYCEFSFCDKESWIEYEIKYNEKISNDIEYHKKKYQDDIEIAKSRTKWVQQLKASLNDYEQLNKNSD